MEFCINYVCPTCIDGSCPNHYNCIDCIRDNGSIYLNLCDSCLRFGTLNCPDFGNQFIKSIH